MITVAAIFVCCGERPSAPRTGNDDFGEQIPILGWFGIPVSQSAAIHYQTMKEAGFTHNLPGDYVTDPSRVLADLNNAQTAGIKVFIVGGALTENAADTAFVSRLTSHPALAGYKVWDEPFTYDYERLHQQVEKIRSIDPQHPCYINLLHSGTAFKGEGKGIDYNAADIIEVYREAYLRKFAGMLSFISFDQYPVYTGDDGKRAVSDSMWYRTLEIVSGEARKLGKPFWAFALATAHSVPWCKFPVPSINDLRLQVYSNLAYGAQCIQYFTYWTPSEEGGDFHDGPVDWYTGNKNPVYGIVQQMNREVIALSKVFLNAEVLWTAHAGRSPHALCTPLSRIELPDAVRTLEITGSDGAVVSLLKKGSGRFLVVVNRDLNQDMTVTIKGNALKRIEKDGSVVVTAGQTHTVTPGDVLIYSLNSD